MRIAVEGCAHGELQVIYETIGLVQRKTGERIDLLLCCGDFQSNRNTADLRCMACPIKYQSMCSFWRYYNGELKAPVLTIFIGGNHEASNFLQELPYGGWVAPNIYYLGYAGVVRFRGVRIAGLSGIYKGHDYLKGHFEAPPYSEETKRSVYHVRNLEVFRLKQLQDIPPDIMMSHDWPRGIHRHGDEHALLSMKPFFKSDIENDTLGSRPSQELLDVLKPKYWFSGHLHVKFSAFIEHAAENKTDAEVETRRTTKFLALDKCLPRRQFLQVLELPDPDIDESGEEFEYDRQWLAVLRSTDGLLSVSVGDNYMPGPGYPGRYDYKPTEEELKEIDQIVQFDYSIPRNFVHTAPVSTDASKEKFEAASEIAINPQTVEFCKKFGVTDPLAKLSGILRRESESEKADEPKAVVDGPWLEEEADVTLNNSASVSMNPDEIELGDDEWENEEGSTLARPRIQLPKPKALSVEGEELFCIDLTGVQDAGTPKYIAPDDSTTLKNMSGLPISDNIIKSETLATESITADAPCDEQTTDFPSQPPKKFKRRNASIYAADDAGLIGSICKQGSIATDESKMKTEILDLAKRLRQERLFVASEKQQLQDLNERVMKTVEKLTHVSWISRQQRTNLDSLIRARLDSTPGDCCRKAAILDAVNFVDSYKVLGHHEASYGEFLQYLRENPQALAALLANAEKSGHPGDELHEISAIVMCSLYGNCILRQDEDYALQLLKHLMETQLTGAEDPCRLLRRESCAFSRIYKALSEGLFQAKLFLTAALHDPIIELLMEDEEYLDADPLENLERYTPQEKAEKFGSDDSSEYATSMKKHRQQVVEKLASLTSRFIDGIKGSSYCFPSCLSWVLRQVYQMLSTSTHRANLGSDVLAPRPTTEVDSVCVDLVFSFFICPAIINPEPYGIAADAHITPVARHNLMQVAQILQVLAMRRWDEKTDPRQADLYAKFPKGVMTPFLDMVLNGPMDETAGNGGMFSHFDGIARNAVLITEPELHFLVNFACRVRRTSCEDLDTKALDSLLNALPTPKEEDNSGHASVSGSASGSQNSLNNGEHAQGLFGAALRKNLIQKVSKVKKKVTAGGFHDSIDDSMDHSGATPSIDVLVVRIQQNSPECPGMLNEQKFLTLEEHNVEGRRIRHKQLHHGRIGNALPSESSLQSQEDEKESLASGGASGIAGGSHEVLEKRTRFSLSQDDGSIGNTSDNLEAISEAASNHSVSSSLEMDDNAEDQINYDNLSDMVSANVSGRGTPNVSGRDTPSSQVTEGDDGVGPDNRSARNVGPSAEDEGDPSERQPGLGLGRQGGLNFSDLRLPRPGSGRMSNPVPGQPGNQTNMMGGKQQSREDIQDKFGKFEFPSLLDGQRPRPPFLEGDETVSLVSDTWSTDVLASDSETIPDGQLPPAALPNHVMGVPFAASSGLPAMLSVGQDPTRDFGPIGPHGVPRANPLLDVPESIDGASEAWSTDVLASDSERLTEIDTDDSYSVARSDDTARSEIEVDIQLENAVSSDSRGNRSPIEQWPQSSAFQRFRQGSTVSVTSSVSSSSSALRQGGVSSFLDANLDLDVVPAIGSSSTSLGARSEAVVRFADEFGLQMATDMGRRATQEDRVGSSTSMLAQKAQPSVKNSCGNPVITVNGGAGIASVGVVVDGAVGGVESLSMSFREDADSLRNGGGSVVAALGSGSSGSDSHEAMDVDELGTKEHLQGEVSSSDAIAAEVEGNLASAAPANVSVDGNKIAKSISFDNSANRDGSGIGSDESGMGKSSKRGFFKGGFRLPFRGRSRKPARGGSNDASPGIPVFGNPHEDFAGSSSGLSPRRGASEYSSDPGRPAESSDDILAKYRKKSGRGDLPDSSTNSHQSGSVSASPSHGIVLGNVEASVEDEEVAELMTVDSVKSDDGQDAKLSFEDAKRKLRLVLSTADFQIFPHAPFGDRPRNSLANGCERKRGSDDNELRGLLQLQLAEAINVGDRFLGAQIHEALRCISTLDAVGCVRLFRALKEDYKKRTPYIAYLIRSRQGLLSALSFLERLLNRVEKDKDVCSTFLVSMCASSFLEKCEASVTEFRKEFARLNASDEKSELVKQFLEKTNAALDKDVQWAAANDEQRHLGSMALERAVMSQIYVLAMYPNGDGDILRDQVLHDHMAKLSKIITPNHKALRIPKVYHLECPWASAQAEIATINAYKAPRDKINCVCRCAKTIMTLLSIADEKAHSADDFIPVLVYVLIKANPRHLLSTIQYVNSFSGGILVSGEEEYWWTQFASAVEFIKTIDY